MPPKNDNNEQPAARNQGTKRNPDQDQSESRAGQTNRPMRPLKRRRGEPSRLPIVDLKEVSGGLFNKDQGGVTGAHLMHASPSSQEPQEAFVAPVPGNNAPGPLKYSLEQINQIQSGMVTARDSVVRNTGDPNPDVTVTFLTAGEHPKVEIWAGHSHPGHTSPARSGSDSVTGTNQLFTIRIEGAITAEQQEMQDLLGTDRRQQRRLGPSARGAGRKKPTPPEDHSEDPCGNCDRMGHLAKACIKVSGIGDIEACIICNTKEHLLDDCLEWKTLNKRQRFELITKGRANLPFVRCASEDCFSLAIDFEPLPDGYPWSRLFAIKFYRAHGELWKTYDYASNTPALPLDPKTTCEGVLVNNAGLESRYRTKDQLKRR